MALKRKKIMLFKIQMAVSSTSSKLCHIYISYVYALRINKNLFQLDGCISFVDQKQHRTTYPLWLHSVKVSPSTIILNLDMSLFICYILKMFSFLYHISNTTGMNRTLKRMCYVYRIFSFLINLVKFSLSFS